MATDTRSEPGSRDERWWLLREDLERMAEQAWEVGWREYEKDGPTRRQNAKDADELYDGVSNDLAVEAPSYNIIQACTDVLVANTVRNKIRPFFLTKDGEYDDKTKAEMMQKAVEGDFERAGLWGEMGRQFCYDGNKYDAGMVWFSPDYANKQILIERGFAWEFFVPEREARRGKPHQGFRFVDIDRSVLLDRLGPDASEEVKQAVLDAPAAPADWYDEDQIDDEKVTDRVMVGEFWHLPSGKPDKSKDDEWDLKTATHDGVHCWVLGGTSERNTANPTMLRAEAWPFGFFPCMEYKPRKKSRSYWSRSVPETIIAAQIAVNRMNKRIDGVMHLHAVPKTYLWSKARVNPEKLTNAHDGVVTGDAPAGQAISWHTPPSMPGDYLDRVDKLIAWAEKQLGIPEMAVVPNKPKGIEHAPALQFLSEEHAVRQTPSFQAWEEAYVGGARVYIEMARLMAKRHPDFSVTWGDSKDLQHFRWKDVDLDDDRFKLGCYPTNLFALNPATKMQQLVDLTQSGGIPPGHATLFLADQYPDVKMLTGDTTSAEKVIQKRIQRVVKDGYNEACAPDGFINLEMAEMIGISKINYYEANGLEESKLDELRAWVKDVQTKRKELADLAAMEEANRMAAASGQMPPALGAGPPGAPPGPPSPPPQDPAGGAGVMPPGVPPAGPMMTEESAMPPM